LVLLITEEPLLRFLPDDTIFQASVYNYETLANRMRELSYLNKGIKITLIDERDKNENGEFRSDEFFSQGGLMEFVKYLDSTRESIIPEPIHVEGVRDNIVVEVALQYNTTYSENIFSYVNNINTIEGGTHVAGFRRALTRTFKAYGEKNKLFEKLKVEIVGDDFREGLNGYYFCEST
jgi:DNA gyrase subunit B